LNIVVGHLLYTVHILSVKFYNT